jgi:hypothetical protein
MEARRPAPLEWLQMQGATLPRWPGSGAIYDQQAGFPVKAGGLGDEIPTGRLSAARGFLVGVALSAGLWGAIFGSIAIFRH